REPNASAADVYGIPIAECFFLRFYFSTGDHAMDFLRAWRALPNYLFHLAYARDHSAGRELLRILAAPRNSYRDVDPALRSLRSAISEEDRLINITHAARLQSYGVGGIVNLASLFFSTAARNR